MPASTFTCVFPWCPITRHVLSYPILSYPILSYPILSYPILSHPILSDPILSDPILSDPILSYPFLPLHQRLTTLHRRVGTMEAELVAVRRSFQLFTEDMHHQMNAVLTALRTLPTPARAAPATAAATMEHPLCQAP